MLEGLVAWILNNYLGKYVENLNTDQLSIALLSGEVELENLPLKKNAFNNLGIPLRVQAGFVGKIKLQIPLRQIRSAPWVIIIEQLYLVATPINLCEWNSDVEESISQEYKLSILDALEAQWRAETESHPESGYYASSISSWMNYGTSLVTNIIENLQLKIKDVHIRFEDKITSGENNAFACGIIMESFSAESCDSDWQRSFTTYASNQSAGHSFKLLELQNMAFYWDQISEPRDFLADLSLSELAVKMSEMLKTNRHQFIVSPVSAMARLKRERCEQPLRSRNRPRLTCHLSLEEVPIILSNKQYNQMINGVHGLNTIGRIRTFRQIRPNVPVMKNVRAWWVYAVKCYFPEYFFMDTKPTWESCLSSAKQCIRYVDVYTNLLKVPSSTLTPDVKNFKDKVEWNLTYEQLKLLRESAIRRIPSKRNSIPINEPIVDQERAQSRSMLMQWFPQWWGWYNATVVEEEAASVINKSINYTPDLEGEILDVIADSMENNTVLKRDAVFGSFEFSLAKGSLQLCTSIISEAKEVFNKNMLQLHFENVGFSIVLRPRTSSYTLNVNLGAIYLKDYITENTLFKTLISSQGTIRDNLCNLRFSSAPPPTVKTILSNSNISNLANSQESLFQLIYESKPVNLSYDYRLYVKSQSLEIVYNAQVIKWLVDFFAAPLSSNNENNLVGPNISYTQVKNTTKMHLINQWENMLQGDTTERKSWNLELDISAPQIYLLEKFTDKNGLVAVLDFGKMHLTNGTIEVKVDQECTEDDDNEMFMTPCSTPPGSEASDMNMTDCGASPLPSDTPQPQPNTSLNQDALLHRLYDRYKIEFRDLQILIGKIKDNWKFSNVKGTSSLHIIDRFNILLQIERRVIYTSDPQYPSVTLSGSLPDLIVHINEHKLLYIQSIIAKLSSTPQNINARRLSNETRWNLSPTYDDSEELSESEITEKSCNQLSRLFMVQFSIDQMSLEIQSRGRSIAEVQVCGVKAAFTKRIYDYNLSLSVHSFLLVDALQTYGPDFELLVASHKHVGMDSVSGSIRDSEPTSPMSPSSPPDYTLRHQHPPPPAALTQALHSLNTQNSSTRLCVSPVAEIYDVPAIGIIDSEALIVIELVVVTANCPTNQGEELIIANILFNNLDIIANQETIVELIGFAKRITYNPYLEHKVSEDLVDSLLISENINNLSSPKESNKEELIFRSEITFDFHRLSVLLLRASIEDGNVIGKKIATATMSDAKIQATIGNKSLELTGSLGGLQVVSLCPGTTIHQRILSVGHDPLIINVPTSTDLITSLSQEIYRGLRGDVPSPDEQKAFSFKINKTVITTQSEEDINYKINDNVKVNVYLHMASVWYTHSGVFIGEIQSCASEFKQYLSNLARSIKTAATGMAIGLVNPRGEYHHNNARMSASTEWISPRRLRSISLGPQEVEELDNYSNIILKIDIILETPVVVLPRSPSSTDVFVARLGNISITNKSGLTDNYFIKIKDINVYSLDIADRLNNSETGSSIELIYKCGSYGKPILHDTTIHFNIEHTESFDESQLMNNQLLQINGKVVTPLKVSATRQQYEQLLETINSIAVTFPNQPSANESSSYKTDSTGITTLNLDPELRAHIINTYTSKKPPSKSLQYVKVHYQLPIFTIELRGDFGKGEQSLVDLSFRDFFVKYERCHPHETNIEMSLRSITMEDLLRETNSRHRFMMLSHKNLVPKSDFVSHSNPDLTNIDSPTTELDKNIYSTNERRNSLPSHFKKNLSFEKLNKNHSKTKQKQQKFSFPQDNLVLISIKMVEPEHPLFVKKYKSVRKSTKINFNSLDLVISIESWIVVLDFFGMGSDADSTSSKKSELIKPEDTLPSDELINSNTETDITVQSLNVVLLRPLYEVCRANISRLNVILEDRCNSNTNNGGRRISGTLGSMSLIDLSPHGYIWRERFLSSGSEVLNFQYDRFTKSDALRADCDTRLSIEMSSIVLVHTKRFVNEIQAFFREFSQLRSVLSQARQKVSVTANSKFTRMQIQIKCLSPAILIPVSGNSTSLLVAELGNLTVNNTFKKTGSEGTISVIRDIEDPVRELLDVMTINLENMDLYCGEKYHSNEDSRASNIMRKFNEKKKQIYAKEFGASTIVYRQGPFLLSEKCGLTLQVEKNLEFYHNVADMSIQGTLKTLDGSIDLQQYKVIKGLLSHNLGENIDDLYLATNIPLYSDQNDEKIWTLTSIRFDLLNVTLRLETQHNVSSLACINFIKSRLLVETFSDMTQDIDLVSQEILLSDIRFKTDPVNKRCNVFSNIVLPMGKAGNKNTHSVQAEVHARKRKEHSAYTIMVNSMRLMAIIDWWQAVNEFIMSPPIGSEPSSMSMKQTRYVDDSGSLNYNRSSPVSEAMFELKVNITDSQIVFVEDTSQWDTNAIILKSTIVMSYKPGSEPKPLSCVLNHCEVFSCVLGMEEETALSIIDPVTLQIDMTSTKILQIQSPQLSIRLSYHDVCMLIKMFHSLPQQTRSARAAHNNKGLPANKSKENINKLGELGFSIKDCEAALSACDDNIECAAVWLTENSRILHFQNQLVQQNSVASDSQFMESFQVKSDCISICIIDDCRDSDVPLLELSLSDMNLMQDLRSNQVNSITQTPLSPPLCLSPVFEMHKKEDENGPGSGRLQCKLTSDYYNRALSGWEPFIEPWSCDASWDRSLTTNSQTSRLQVELNSTETLNINITSTLVELYNLVKNNWTQDYYSLSTRGENSPKMSPPGYKRRSPFVPFALRNLSGYKLWFTTIVTTADIVSENIELPDPDESWVEVQPDEVEPFKFCERGRQRHRDSHKLRLHQLGVRIEGWNSISPVCVDKVGVFFRHLTHTKSDVEARLVFSVTLEGSARKLVTVRSALQLVNCLPTTIEVRADNITPKNLGAVWSSAATKSVLVNSGETWCVPLSHNPTPMWIRPVYRNSTSPTITPPSYLYCAQPLDWRLAARQGPDECLQIPHVCHSNTHTSFRFCCILRREMFPLEKGIPQPGHTIILKSPVRIANLLPIELNYKLGQSDLITNSIAPGQTAPLLQVDVQKMIEIAIYLEGFPGVALLLIPPMAIDSFSSRLKLSDTSGRKLSLNAYVSIKRTDSIKISISAPFWIINRTGIPIVFRQEGVPTETAGQFEEHEIARMVAPLLFSFADSDGSPTVVARVGAGVIHNGTPQWCSPFGLSPGIMVRRLVVSNINTIGGSERILLVGIAIRPGRGRYRHTNICTISPRFQIHNNTSFHLQFAQKCYATSILDPAAIPTYIDTTPKCSIPFHWPNHDQEPLLCVKIMSIPNCNWSGGFSIDTNHSLHINIRDSNAVSYFLRLEVILQGATFFIVFTDADTMPPPIRIDNFAFVHLHFHQTGCKEESLIKAHSSKPWALVEPCGATVLAIRAPGGTRTTVNLQKLDETKSLSYQNFIYIAFTGTHQNNIHPSKVNAVENSQLVLEVASGPSSSGIVFLAKKRDGERAQLWRLNKDGHLLHEGSSPPQPANAPPDVNAPHALVLDIEGSAPQPRTMVGLCVRRVHPRRSSTQTWRFTYDGQLCCAYNNMIVQPLDGFFGLREGNRAVLGLPGPPGPNILPNGLPIEHAVSSQTLRPGSGFLQVTVTTDGPTRVIKITDVEQHDNTVESSSKDVKETDRNAKEIQIRVAVGGIGLSLVSQFPAQELLFCLFSGILLEGICGSQGQKLNLSIQDIQIDNQLLGTQCPVLLHTIKPRGSNSSGRSGTLPAINLSVERVASPPETKYNAHIFKHFIVSLRPIAIHFEEKLLLKLCLWAGIGGTENTYEKEEADETDFETQRILTEITAVHAKRYYFGVLRLIPNQIRLSMQTASKLPPSLAAIKKRLGLRLIKFEDAGVELEPFIRYHPFETSQFLWHSIVKHYKDELKWQAAIILGSVDFLGNPLGFVQDVSDGVSGLIYEGNVGALVKNVAHGISNSAAKVSESLGDGIGRVIMDEAHEETRARIRGTGEGGGTNHLVAGLRGLGLGLLGGVTSLVKHTYEGAAHQGLPGFFTGVGRGLIGTVTKPVVGVLDLAAETAAAVRDTSRRSDRWIPERCRPPRSPMGPGGLLPRYSLMQSNGHQYLYIINERDYEEEFLAYDCIRGQSSDIRALISTRYFRVFTCTNGEPHIVIEAHLSNLVSCQAVTNALGESYIELTVKVDGTGGLGVRRPQVQCDTPDLARWVSHQVNYAKCMFHEKLFTLQCIND